MKSSTLVFLAFACIALLVFYYEFSVQDFVQDLYNRFFSGEEPCPDGNRDGYCDTAPEPTITTTSTTFPDSRRVTVSASILALTESEINESLGGKWVYFKKPYFMPAGGSSYGKYVQDVYDGSKNIEDKNTSVTFSPKRRIRIYTEVYTSNALPLGTEVFDARDRDDWEMINENVYKKNYNPADTQGLNVDYEIYYRNVNVLIVSENLEILYIADLDKLALRQFAKLNATAP